MTIKEFIKLPFKKQVHICILAYMKSAGISPYINKKMNPVYFKVKCYLAKQSTTCIKNIFIMLVETGLEYPLYKLSECSCDYVNKKHNEKVMQQQEELDTGDYEIDLEAFLK